MDHSNCRLELVSTQVAPMVYTSHYESPLDNFNRSLLRRDDVWLPIRQDSAADCRVARVFCTCNSAATGIVFEANSDRS